MIAFVGLVVLLWTGALCRVPPAWTAGEDLEDDRAPLEDVLDNQENVLTQLLGDYDKVKTLSEGPDCRCRCLVRPLSRSACRRIEEGSGEVEDFYTVETVAGPNCKSCACVAPPSALNPCQGEFRFKKLQEAGKDVKISTIMDVLEGALYGMDLLKLHSVTTKLLERVENIEKSVSRNETKVGAKGARDHPDDPEGTGSKAAAASSHGQKRHEERSAGGGRAEEEPMPTRIKAGTKDGMSIRSLSFYKAEAEEDENGEHNELDDGASGDGPVDLLIDEQIPEQQHAVVLAPPTANPRTATTPSLTWGITTAQPGTETGTSEVVTASTEPLSSASARTTRTTRTTTANQSGSGSVLPKATRTQHGPSTSARKQKSRLTWDEGPTPSTAPPKSPGVCKDTLASIGDPVTHNTYGPDEGAWMKDPKGNGNVIYVTRHYYGNALLEFRDLEAFKQGRPSNSYELPYSYAGAGHVIYGGALYYSRAFSRDIIKFDLRLRRVPAWTTLHDAAPHGEDGWGGGEDVDLAVDEAGLWVVYAALDEDAFHQEVIVLSRLSAADLRREGTWRTGLRGDAYGSSFLVCGVLYAVGGHGRANATVSYAFDTHTRTQTAPRLPIGGSGGHASTARLHYNPRERALYAWDRGRQVTYGVVFAY